MFEDEQQQTVPIEDRRKGSVIVYIEDSWSLSRCEVGQQLAIEENIPTEQHVDDCTTKCHKEKSRKIKFGFFSLLK